MRSSLRGLSRCRHEDADAGVVVVARACGGGVLGGVGVGVGVVMGGVASDSGLLVVVVAIQAVGKHAACTPGAV